MGYVWETDLLISRLQMEFNPGQLANSIWKKHQEHKAAEDTKNSTALLTVSLKMEYEHFSREK